MLTSDRRTSFHISENTPPKCIFFKNRWSLLIAGESVDVNQMINPIWIIYFRKNEKSQIFHIIRISNYSSSIQKHYAIDIADEGTRQECWNVGSMNCNFFG